MSATALYFLAINETEQLPFFSPFYGDPISTAKRFLRMRKDKCFDKTYVMQFLRANADVEFARDHNRVSDYIYTLDNNGVLRASLNVKTGWDVFFEGRWQDFTDLYNKEDFAKAY